MRQLIGEYLVRWLPGDTGAIASGILIGGSDWLSYETQADMAKVGLLHVVAASGYNVTVVSGWLMAAGVKTLGRKWGIYLAMGGVVGYMALAGWSSSVVRAGIMAVMVLAAQALGRKSEAGWLLGLTAVGMVLVKPEYLTDIGWQLSVAATAGLLWVKPVIDGKWSGWGVLGEDLRTSLAAQLTTMPIILFYFGNVSAVSPVVNAMVLWTVPLAMQICAIAVTVGLVIPVMGQIIALMAWPFLAYMIGVVKWVADQPFGGWEVGRMSLVWVGAYYLALGIGMVGSKKK